MKLILSLFLFFFAVVIHEYAHGWVAYKFGDPTARFMGRLTLNPLAHIDPFGTIILPLFLILTRSPVLFGWAKPVPIDFLRLKNPKKDMIWVGLAGPVANVLLTGVFAALLNFLPRPLNPTFEMVLGSAVFVNLVLATFNLLPVPPLDGSRVVFSLLPRKTAFAYISLEPYGFLIIIVLLYLGITDLIIWPVVGFLAKVLGVAVR